MEEIIQKLIDGISVAASSTSGSIADSVRGHISDAIGAINEDTKLDPYKKELLTEYLKAEGDKANVINGYGTTQQVLQLDSMTNTTMTIRDTTSELLITRIEDEVYKVTGMDVGEKPIVQNILSNLKQKVELIYEAGGDNVENHFHKALNDINKSAELSEETKRVYTHLLQSEMDVTGELSKDGKDNQVNRLYKEMETMYVSTVVDEKLVIADSGRLQGTANPAFDALHNFIKERGTDGNFSKADFSEIILAATQIPCIKFTTDNVNQEVKITINNQSAIFKPQGPSGQGHNH